MAMRLFTSSDVAGRVGALELAWNRHGIDRFGARQDELGRFYTLLGLLYRHYFRVSVLGIDHVPERGRAMLIGNHSGGVAIDALMVIASVFFDKEPPRLAQGMAEKFLIKLPFISRMMQATGQLTGLPENAVRLLQDERLLMVFPEGARGTAKLYHERNTLVRFGTGFMRLALETRTPIIPFGFVGGGDAVPTVANLYKVGRLLGVPYIPVTPYVLPVPKPVSLGLEFGEPMRFDGSGSEDDEVIAGYVEQVTDRISVLIARGVERRGGGNP
jgi:1-acyl-sn-glycerol-3-phosphate acyltransferase